MQTDKTTLKDLSVFSNDGSADVFGLIDNTHTQVGREMLRKHILNPPGNIDLLQHTQDAIKFWSKHLHLWPTAISNGTLIMLEKYFDASDETSELPSGISLMMGSFFQKLLNRNQYFFTQFSLSHLSDFIKGCLQLSEILKQDELPGLLKNELEQTAAELNNNSLCEQLLQLNKNTSYAVLMKLSYRARREMKTMFYRFMYIYARQDMWRSMAQATVNNNWAFPQLLPEKPICFDAIQLFHPLLKNPVAYDIDLADGNSFLLLTGANMSGKTTFMRSIGVAALLAHLGMGVPAASLKLSFLHGIITNMYVEDNLLSGESYFFAEVQRMKLTAQKLAEQKPHLVLMDELFKGTNVHDAFECTKGVVEALLQRTDQLMTLSTHLYEVAQHFNDNTKLKFAFFVTQMLDNGNFSFTYQLRPGISDDRIGYRILQNEGVLDLLKTTQNSK